jgi:hypothetical protein
VTRAFRYLLPLLPLAVLAGCAGQLRDYMGPRAAIVRPQLIRYGFSLPEIACVGERLGETLRPRQLRFLVRTTNHIERPYYNPDRFMPRDFLWASGGMTDRRVQVEVGRALQACHVQANPAPPQAVAVEATAPVAAAPSAAPGTAPSAGGGRPAVWLNLGTAGSGQAISVDGASLEEEEGARTAWFRMIDPPPAGVSVHAYRLRIDCATRTIRPLAHRLYDADGAVTEERTYTPEEALSSPVEGGTVTEIAFLSLCS